MQSHRIPQGGRIDRSKTLRFIFNGRSFDAHPGDTLASALLANGVSLVGRSFKYHRPRGIFTCGADEPNAIVQLGTGAHTVPNARATQIEIFDGLTARSTKGWPGLRFDLAALNDVFGRALVAGFYYKTFMAPRSLWHYAEKIIRRSAGLGTAPREADPDHYRHRNAHCDVLVVGAGPAGLMAALAAGRAGARVIIADEQTEFGGRLLSTTERIDALPAEEWLRKTVTELRSMDEVTLIPRSTVFGYYDHNFLTIAERMANDHANQKNAAPRERLWRVRARQVVLAAGALERPLVFCNNDRPGIMLASAVSSYLHRYAVRPGTRAVVFTNNDSAYRTALDLQQAGVTVAALVDCRSANAGERQEEAVKAGIPLLYGQVVTNVSGRLSVDGVSIAPWSGDGSATVRDAQRIDCDLLAVSGGWSPAVHLHSQSGGKLDWDDRSQCFLPGAAGQASITAGAANGQWSTPDCLSDGHRAGSEAASRCGFRNAGSAMPLNASDDIQSIQPLWRVPGTKDPDRCAKQFVDFQTDVTVADIRVALREGYHNIEHVKRYTGLGFGTDQGKLGNINGLAIVAEYLNKSIPEVGTTTFRPAYTPVTFGTIAGENVGELYDPVRKTTLHEWHVASGAQFEVVGQWMRPYFFPKNGEDLHAAVARESRATRQSVGIMDASTLGKIDVQGRDAVTFLERLYTHNIGTMTVGRCAYGILLGEDGMLKDDGVMARLGEKHFYLTTTTSGAAAVLRWLELWLQTEWPELEVYLSSVSDHYATIVVAGPRSRPVLQHAGCDIDLGNDSFPFMSVRDAHLGGCPVQLFRVSFSGELAFEINVDARYALHLWHTLMQAGAAFDITPYGTEAMHVLRAEKGFFMAGQETDGSVNPVDLGLNWLLSKDKDFLGKRSLSRPDAVSANRLQLVGLQPVDDRVVVDEGSQLLGGASAETACGHVTSSYFSACLGHPIALAMVRSGRSRMNEVLLATSPEQREVPVRIVPACFYDPKGERQNV
jgi:sarcosine oxidase subunit alpha